MDAATPEDFICHPVADARTIFLAQQHGLDGSAGVTLQRFAQASGGKCRFQ
jgi:hypothetical protein